MQWWTGRGPVSPSVTELSGPFDVALQSSLVSIKEKQVSLVYLVCSTKV